MLRLVLCVSIAVLVGCRSAQPTTEPTTTPTSLPSPAVASEFPLSFTPGTRIRPGTYYSPSPDLGSPVLVFRDLSDLTVDLSRVTLDGSPPGTPPDQRQGLAVLIDNCRNLTLTGLTVRGYKVAILARNSPGLTLHRNNLSHNYAPRLLSTAAAEDERDWLSYHNNESDQWLRYGAAIYLDRCPYPTITWNTAAGGQNGLLMTGTDRGLIHSNTFHYLSGVGIGLYRSSFNAVMHNRLDYCVRGYSHGVYSRGQDSAAILVYEQSSNNLFAYNSATHSGDGFFLWAGQSTMDTGLGGSNDNLLYGNDFSHAPTNGVEATFSRNYIVANQIDDCDYGIWAGYSFDTLIAGNTLAGNRTAIAIEHGQNNTILGNHFSHNRQAIRLWARPSQPTDWKYPRLRDTRSRDYLLAANTFAGNADLVLQRTTGVALLGAMNAKPDADSAFGPPLGSPDLNSFATNPPPQFPGALDPFLPRTAPRGRHTIVITPYGPYDGKTPVVVPSLRQQDPGTLVLDLLGPKGRWSISSISGATPDVRSGRLPGQLRLKLPPVATRVSVKLDADGTPLTFDHLHLPLDFSVRFFTYPPTADLTQGELPFLNAISAAPIARERRGDLNYASVPPHPDVPASHYITIAETALPVPPGKYLLTVTADDGIRVYLDRTRMIDEWRHQVPATFRRTLDLTGFQRLRIEHFQITGAARLQLTLTPAGAPTGN